MEEGSQNFRLLRSETKELDQLCNYQPHRVLAFLDASDVLGFGFKQTPSFALEEDSVVFVSTRRAACCSSQRQGLPFLLTHQAFFFCTTSFPLPSYTKCIPFLYETRPPSLPTDQAFLFLKEEALSGSPEETRPLLYETKPPSLPTDQAFLFLKEGTLSGSHEETRPLLYEKKPPSLPTDKTFLFLKEGTLSGSPKETRPLLYEKKRPSLPRHQTFLLLKEGAPSGSPHERRPFLAMLSTHESSWSYINAPEFFFAVNSGMHVQRRNDARREAHIKHKEKE